ncbi:MAG: alpha-glucan family phosphorylase [Acidimicrobiales bacterium]|nr:alpha-glucan family phosphorylase [Acidimicrobiales bacterium]
MYAGSDDLGAAAQALALRLPEPLRPLARVAYDYGWSWTPGGPEVFADLHPGRWRQCGWNPVRLLQEVAPRVLQRAAADPAFVERVDRLAGSLAAERRRPPYDGVLTPAHPAAFFCAEFGVHSSLPIYSGGLGALAGDILKESSDLALPVVGVGLLYRTGYFHQRLDPSGWQQEYWLDTDPERVPAALVTDDDGSPLTVTVPLWDDTVEVQVWRVDVGRVPLYLLDTDLYTSDPVQRWITSRLYEGNRALRIAQYAVLGVGGARALRAMGIDPAVYHFNEGHPALAAFELHTHLRGVGLDWDEAWEQMRRRVVFTTHTPVPAGNETYERDEIIPVLGQVARLTGDLERCLAVGRLRPEYAAEPSGLTALALRASRTRNAVSRRHGEVARDMWQPLFEVDRVEDVPITHVTNGVHLPSWLSPTMRRLLDQHLGQGWLRHADDPATWDAVQDIPAEDLWAARNEDRHVLIEYARKHAVRDRLRRGESLDYVQAAERTLDDGALTIGFARRIATYKRLHLLTLVPERAVRVLDGEQKLQFIAAGKAHPSDEGAKRIVQRLFGMKHYEQVASQVAFLEDHDLSMAAMLVRGCDVWVNLPRPPLEASGTSGMKAAANGALNLSVLDGWWAEAYDGDNGWAIDGDVSDDDEEQDRRHAEALFDLLEHEVKPLFYDRDEAGVPQGWVRKVKHSLRTIGPCFSATRMVRDYATRVYPADAT